MSQFDSSSAYLSAYYNAQQGTSSLPQASSSSQSYTSSPEDAAQARNNGKNESPMYDIVGYMADLPSLSEVKAACDCYADECGELGTCYQLCYISRNQLVELWLQLCSMQMTKLQLALLYAVLANVGLSTPAGHPQYSLDALLSSKFQQKCISQALALLDEVERTEYEPPHSFMRCHVLLIITVFQQSAGQYQESWNSCKRAITAAHKCRLFYLQEWANDTPANIKTVKILQAEIFFLFNWMACIMGAMDKTAFEPHFPEVVIPSVQSSDALDQALMRQKLQSSTMARKAALQTQHIDHLSSEETLKLAISIDDEILAYLESMHNLLKDTTQYYNIDPNDRSSVFLATTAFLAKSGLMLQRWRLAQSFYERYPLDIYQHIALSSARTTLQMLPVVEKFFRSPWQTITVRSWADGTFNQVLYVFLTAIKTQLYQESSLQTTTKDTRFKQAIKAELVFFMSHFDQFYNSMSQLGMVRTALAQCAAAIKETPVEIRQEYSSSTTDQPIFPLSQDCDYKVSQHNTDAVSRTLKDHYDNHTVFKLAVEAHSKIN